jgi:hypothetical protein
MSNRSKLSQMALMRRPPAKVTFTDDPAFLLSDWRDVKVFRASAVYSGQAWYSEGQQIRWSSVLGIGMATLLSAAFWAVLAIIIARFWG